MRGAGWVALGLPPSDTALALYLRPEDRLDDLLANYWADARMVTEGAPDEPSVLDAVDRLRQAASPDAALPRLLNEVVGEYSAASSGRAERLHDLTAGGRTS